MRVEQVTYTPEELLAFEEDIAQEFAAGKIQSPIHLSGGNEEHLIRIFKHIQPHDWILCGWRSHYHCLLKGVPPDKLKAAIMAGQSVSLCFPEYKVLSSGIVGGTAPIALGIAKSLKQREAEGHNYESHVWVFLGDMTAETGIVHECMKYAAGHKLPVCWVIENNGVSVCTPTKASWGTEFGRPVQRYYGYQLKRPHSGIGQWVRF